MQKFNACKKRDWLIHFFFSTSSVCIIAICPVGPPKEINPSLSQNRNASPKLGCRTEASLVVKVVLIATGKVSKVIHRPLLKFSSESHPWREKAVVLR